MLGLKINELCHDHGPNCESWAMTRNNYPVKLELWIGDINETGFSPTIPIDAVCFDAQSIEPNRTYYFSSCNK